MSTERIFLHTESGSLLWPPAEEATSAYDAVLPDPMLRGHVERIHQGYEWIPPGSPIRERVLADGSIYLIFNFGDAPAGVDGGTGYPAEVVGPTIRPNLIEMVGWVEQVGVRLRPGAAAAVLGVPAGELTDRSVPLDELWGDRAREVHERLVQVPRGQARTAAVERVLLELLGSRDEARPHVVATQAIRRIEEAGGRIRVRDLAESLGIGERRIGQIFHEHVGLSPKAVCRLARIRACMTRLSQGGIESWSRIALDCGFYDQSHLIHELRSIVGLSPGALKRQGFGFFQDDPDPPL